MSTTSFRELLVRNLTGLNAKEREHLIRWAYRGDMPGLLSDSLINALQQQSPPIIAASAECVFAGMDYHLDWLYAALYLSCRGLTVEQACAQGIGEALQREAADNDASLQPVTGTQEDTDLLAVFADGEKTEVLCIEAKGVGSFGGTQLARKLVRLGNMLRSVKPLLPASFSCRLVLAGPDRPYAVRASDDIAAYVSRTLRDRALAAHLADLPGQLGKGCSFVTLDRFPASLMKVTRFGDATSGPKAFTHWKITRRYGRDAVAHSESKAGSDGSEVHGIPEE